MEQFKICIDNSYEASLEKVRSSIIKGMDISESWDFKNIQDQFELSLKSRVANSIMARFQNATLQLKDTFASNLEKLLKLEEVILISQDPLKYISCDLNGFFIDAVTSYEEFQDILSLESTKTSFEDELKLLVSVQLKKSLSTSNVKHLVNKKYDEVFIVYSADLHFF